MAARGGAPAVPAILELLRRGLPASLAQAALETVADTESETASETVAWYARHRDAGLRRAAVAALGKTGGPVAVSALRAALSDPDPTVRSLAATGLGDLKANAAVGDLFAALDHRVTESARSIGFLCLGQECDRLAQKLGQVTFDVAVSGLEPALLRPAADVNDEVKIQIVARLRELGTAEVNHFLRGVQARWPARQSPRVKQAIDQAVFATSASPGASGDMQ
jgi:HEAT repeat protein